MQRLVICITLLVAACSPSRSIEDFQAQLEHQQAKIADIERDLVNARQETLRQRTASAAAATDSSAEQDRAVNQLSGSIEKLRAQLADMDDRLSALEKAGAPVPAAEPEPAPGKILPSKGVPVSIYTAPDNRSADFIETPQGESVDLFPVRITGAAGRKTVVATHMTTKLVNNPTGEKDEYGRTIPERREVQEPLNEYAYEVVFSAQNLTRTDKSMNFTAGGGTRTLTLKPGEILTDVSVRSAFGADLHVEVGGMVRNFPVTY